MTQVSGNPLQLRVIDHIVLRVRDIEKAIGFYRDVLGCTLEKEQTDLGLYQLRAGASLIDLVDVAGKLGGQFPEPPSARAPNMDHVCLQVDPWDAAAITAHLERHGVEAGEVGNRYGATGYGPSIYINDPEGNVVELKGPPAADD